MKIVYIPLSAVLALCALAALAVALRIITRLFVVKHFGKDDICMSVAGCVIIILAVLNGIGNSMPTLAQLLALTPQ